MMINKELDLYLALDKVMDDDYTVIGRFHNSIYAKSIIKALKKVVTGDHIFRVLIYNKEANEEDIIKYGFQIAYMASDKEDFEESAIYNMDIGVK